MSVSPKLKPSNGCLLALSQSQLLAMARHTDLICYFSLLCSFHPSPPAASQTCWATYPLTAFELAAIIPPASNAPAPGVLSDG